MPKPLKFDMVFLDHLKPLYTIDLKVMEEEGLVGPVSFAFILIGTTPVLFVSFLIGLAGIAVFRYPHTASIPVSDPLI